MAVRPTLFSFKYLSIFGVIPVLGSTTRALIIGLQRYYRKSKTKCTLRLGLWAEESAAFTVESERNIGKKLLQINASMSS